MEEISVEGKKYLKAKLVARELGYTNDYVGQLCRADKVDAKLVGRTWYVDPKSVEGHKQTRYRSSKAATKKKLKSSVKEIISKMEPAAPEHFYAHKKEAPSTQIQYEADESQLLPEPTKKSSRTELPVELADAQKVTVGSDNENRYSFETPKRKETKFFGTLEVTDFITEVSVGGDEETPQPVKVSGTKKVQASSVKLKSAQTIPGEPIKSPNATKPKNTFEARLHPVKIEDVKKKVALPVMVDEQEVTLPVVYHIVTAVAFVSSLMIAAACIGMEANVIATNTTVFTEYAFTVKNLSALLYLVK